MVLICKWVSAALVYILVVIAIFGHSHLAYSSMSQSTSGGGSNDVSLKLFHALLMRSESGVSDGGLNDTSPNLVIAPYAIQVALGVAALGAKGATLRQFGKAPAELKDSPFGPTGQSFGNDQLSIISRLWIQKDLGVQDSFLKAYEKQMGDLPWFVDFTKAPDFLSDRINGWISEQSRGRIKRFISEDDFSGLSDASQETSLAYPMLLTSAIHFSAKWQKPFVGIRGEKEKRIKETAKFSQSSAGEATRSFIEVSGNFRYAQDRDFEVIEIPYRADRVTRGAGMGQGSEFGFVVFLPLVRFDLGRYSQVSKPDRLEGLLSKLTPQEVRVVLPRFEIESAFDVSNALKKIGIEDPFSKENADFSLMTGKKNLYLGELRTKASLAVSEQGTEAHSVAIATQASRGIASAAAIEFVANRPFLFGVRHLPSNQFIFLGRLAEL